MPEQTVRIDELVDKFYQPVTRFSPDEVKKLFKGFFETMRIEMDSPEWYIFKLVGFGTFKYKPVKAVDSTQNMIGLWERNIIDDEKMRQIFYKLFTIAYESHWGRERLENYFPRIDGRLRKADWWAEFCDDARKDFGFRLKTLAEAEAELNDRVRDSAEQ